MATSGIFMKDNGAVDYYFNWRRTSYSAYTNTSTIVWELISLTESWTGTSATMNYLITIDGVNYRCSGASGTSAGDKIIIGSGTAVISHAVDGYKTFSAEIRRTGSNIQPTTSTSIFFSGTGTLDRINRGAYITSYPTSFTDEENPSIMYNNPGGEKVSDIQVCIATEPPVTTEYSVPIIPYRSVSNPNAVSGLYTFELTNEERKEIRKYVVAGYQRPLRFYVRTIIEGQTFLNNKSSQINLVDYEPEITATVEDVDARTLELTGDKNKFIRYRSDAYFTTKTVMKKEAEYERMWVDCGGVKKYENVLSGTFADVDGNTFNQIQETVLDGDYIMFSFGVFDNRGNAGYASVVKRIVKYIEPTNNLTLGKLEIITAGTYDAQLTFTVSGKYFNGSFGAKSNTMEIEYRVVDEDGNDVFMDAEGKVWVPLGTVNPTITNGDNYKYSYTIRGLDYRKGYTVYVNVIDELTPEVISAKAIAAIPVFDWGKSDFAHHTDVYLDNNKCLKGRKTDGSDIQLIAASTANNIVVGDSGAGGDVNVYGNNVNLYPKTQKVNGVSEYVGNTNIYGNNININPKGNLLIKGRIYGANQVLWDGGTGFFMHDTQVAKLAQPITNQPNGIVLVFSLYRNGASEDVSINTFFVSKREVELMPGAPHTFIMGINAGLSTIGAKYLYISDTEIRGHASNAVDATEPVESGLVVKNKSFVLRYVIGV